MTSSTVNNSVYTFAFQTGYTIKEGATLSVSSIIVPYSWFNITSVYGNNKFTYTWVGASPVTYTVTIPDGFYSTADLNTYLQSVMITNGNYLLDSNGNYVYYIEFLTNQSAYAIQLLTYVVPLTLPTGYTNPGSMVFSSGTAYTPYITVPSSTTTNSFSSLIGFPAGQYPPTATQSTNYSYNGTLVPNTTPINSVIVKCNLVANNSKNPSDILDSFTFQNTAFGSNGVYMPTFPSRVALKAGTYNQLIITFVDQNFNTIYAKDPNTLITLLIENN
jgi:hypothetical protein